MSKATEVNIKNEFYENNTKYLSQKFSRRE